MISYPTYQDLDLPGLARQVAARWQREGTFARSVKGPKDAGRPPFVFYEGPPSANGTPGIHHVMARTIKDAFCRYKTQQGYFVERRAGWDTHGLPVELQVERELGITKEDIGTKITVEAYNEHCRRTVMRYTDEWRRMTDTMGYWVDMDRPYVTYETPYIESLWALIRTLYDRGLMEKGYTIQPFSPAAGTGLSSHELNQPGAYRQVRDTSIVAQFQLTGPSKERMAKGHPLPALPVSILAWTTTPWTLPANSALAVAPGIVYEIIETINTYTGDAQLVILAQAAVGRWLEAKQEVTDPTVMLTFTEPSKQQPWRRVRTLTGADLIGLEYEPLMPYVIPEGPAFRVIEGDFVSTEDGTGIVHISPTFGADDARVAKKAGIVAILVRDAQGRPQPIVDRQGRFAPEITDFAGMYVKNYQGIDEKTEGYRSTDVLISIKLKEQGRAFRVERYEHSYPHCWRTDMPILYYPLESWFIKTTAVRDQMIAANATITWRPESTGTGRFGKWLENVVDWNLSRSRYWGTPLPIWRTDPAEAGTPLEVCIGSLAELERELSLALESALLDEEARQANTALLEAIRAGQADLHRPFVDRIRLVREGRLLTRETDVIDVWFDSGAMPYAQIGYPTQTTSLEGHHPADFIAEGVDQTRGWFYTLHALSVMLTGKPAFKAVVSNGLVLDRNGDKMSKRLGNAVDPFEVMGTYGPDATRWYMLANADPWDNLKFHTDSLAEGQRRFFGTVFNTYQFYALYANIDGHTVEGGLTNATEDQPTQVLDQWILARLDQTLTTVTERLDDYDPTPAVRAIQEFVDEDLSNWYVRLNRRRFWRGQLDEDKRYAYRVLHHCLTTVAAMMAPFAPFYADQLFGDLNPGADSVHLMPWPRPLSVPDASLLARMDLARRICSMVHGVRKKHAVKVRRPVRSLAVPAALGAGGLGLLMDTLSDAAMTQIMAAELNIKEVKLIAADDSLIRRSAKLNFKEAGRRLGQAVKEAGPAVAALSDAQIRSLLEQGTLSLPLSSGPVELTVADVEIAVADVPGWIIATDGPVTVALDMTVTPELAREGMAREMVNRIQNLRKEAGLAVTDRIELTLSTDDKELLAALGEHSDYIADEVLATGYKIAHTEASAELTEEPSQHAQNPSQTLEVDGVTVTVSLTPAQHARV